MNIETCVKYLDYVAIECDRHLLDGQVSDDELVNLIIEFQRFQEKIGSSDLPDEIKLKVLGLKLDYSIKGVERGNWYAMIGLLTFGSASAFYSIRKQEKRKETLFLLKLDVSQISSYIKLNY